MAPEVFRDGVFAVNKPCGQSSAQIIRDCQQKFNPSEFFKPVLDGEMKKLGPNPRKKEMRRVKEVKMGHGGTLDPLATGILILGVGSATKALSQFIQCMKTYEAVVVFGAATDTYDRVGRILSRRPYEHITKEKVLEALEDFRGKQTQIPPLYSALKMNGKPLYEYAREGKPIPREIAGREVEVTEMEMLEWYEPGTHNHRWPTEEAEAAERNLAEQVWSVKKAQETNKPQTPDEKKAEDKAVAAHESFKREFEERQDELVRDGPSKRARKTKNPPMMSGALGNLPDAPGKYSNKGRDLVGDRPDENTPPPWTDKGPPAVKVRMTVSSGYYIRSFCHDLGAKLDSAALMAELCRTRQSDFTVGGVNCIEYDDIVNKDEKVWGPQIEDMFARWHAEPESQFRAGKKQDNSRREDRKHEFSAATPSTEDSPKRTHAPNEESRKRAREEGSRSASPPRKVADRRSSNHESEKSWNGIQD